MDKTPFAGLTRLDPGDSLSEDNSSFQSVNPTLIDRFLRRAIMHEHTGAPGLDDPPTAPDTVADPTTGVIPADTTVLVGYTLVDDFGGETLVSPTSVISTDAPLGTPEDMPTLTLDNVAGTLTIGDYSYAVSFTDGSGGETPVGPLATVTRTAGPANAEVVVSGLIDIVASNPGAAGWRLYRARDGGQFYFLAEGDGTMDAVTDDGTLCADCTGTPLDDSQNTTSGTNAIKVTVPSSSEALLATSIRLYASTTDSFVTPALLDEFLPADLDVEKTYLTLALTAGQPPDTTQSVGQPSQIDAADIGGLQWKDPVADAAALPSSGNTAGDIRVTLDDLTFHAWDGTAWVAAGGGGGAIDGPHTVGSGGGEPAYATGWGEWASPVRFWKDSDGAVHIQGAAYKTSQPVADEIIFTLPDASWFPPVAEMDFIAYCGDDGTPNAPGAAGVTHGTGDVRWHWGPGTATTQSFIHFDITYLP